MAASTPTTDWSWILRLKRICSKAWPGLISPIPMPFGLIVIAPSLEAPTFTPESAHPPAMGLQAPIGFPSRPVPAKVQPTTTPPTIKLARIRESIRARAVRRPTPLHPPLSLLIPLLQTSAAPTPRLKARSSMRQMELPRELLAGFCLVSAAKPCLFESP
ncbi:hypothetical protein BDP67DRAFT_523295 [Colletotrichum lupini]|nr:hypothetical protein BDP67DRAFT_523295 [Colletotrichum lupini]